MTARREARISDDGVYRYSLTRDWSATVEPEVKGIGDRPGPAPRDLWVMLNSSTADGRVDDPTVRRIRAFTQRDGRTRLAVVNLAAFRAPKPETMWSAAAAGVDIIGPENDDTILGWATACDRVICAWGTGGSRLPDRVQFVLDLARDLAIELQCLGLTGSGQPRHPLYVRAETPMVPFTGVAA